MKNSLLSICCVIFFLTSCASINEDNIKLRSLKNTNAIKVATDIHKECLIAYHTGKVYCYLRGVILQLVCNSNPQEKSIKKLVKELHNISNKKDFIKTIIHHTPEGTVAVSAFIDFKIFGAAKFSDKKNWVFTEGVVDSQNHMAKGTFTIISLRDPFLLNTKCIEGVQVLHTGHLEGDQAYATIIEVNYPIKFYFDDEIGYILFWRK